MKKFILFISNILIILLEILKCNIENKYVARNKPVIDIHYESLCPDCSKFILKSLKKFLNNSDLKLMANIKFYPYGNAKEIKKNNSYRIFCQHGPNECYGNMIHGCGLEKLNYIEGLKYLVCIEENILRNNKDFTKTLDNCVDDINLKNDIFNCANGKEGNYIHHFMGLFRPQEARYVPYVTLNGEHNKEIENYILNDIEKFLCLYNQENMELEGCKKYRKY
jgi:hypothetical protein